MDYKNTNEVIIKDKFSILIIDDLLDELKGDAFSKIDLKVNYHQIRMGEHDISKTTFKIYHGHFGFKIMPFGLTSALATFYALMNHLFWLFLRKFVLAVFQVLLDQQLFDQLSKCFYGQNQIEYLGHIILEHGLGMDFVKIEAMVHWPTPLLLKISKISWDSQGTIGILSEIMGLFASS